MVRCKVDRSFIDGNILRFPGRLVLYMIFVDKCYCVVLKSYSILKLARLDYAGKTVSW